MPPDPLHAYIETGLRAHTRDDIGSAITAYRHVLAVSPDHPDALKLLGTALLQIGEPGQAVDCLQRASRRLRDDPGVLGNLAQAYLALARYEDARETYRRASRLNPREVHYQLGVANSFAMQGSFSDAEMLLRKVAGRFPNAALVWFNLGNVMRDLKRPAEAMEHYHKSLALDANLVDARNNLGSVLHSLQRFDDAEREYRACIRIAPEHLLAQCNLASVLIDLGRFTEAETQCRTVLALAPDLSETHTYLGAAVGHQGRMLEALACHREAARLAPDSAKAAETYAAALIETGDFGAGLRWFSHALALNPDPLSIHQMLGTALLAHGCLGDGWVEYRQRPAFIRFREKYASLDLAQTLPADLAGRHICVLREQGLGDEIFFLRFAAGLREAGAQVSYRASTKIAGMLRRLDCLDQVLEENTAVPAADAVIMAGDLAHARNTLPASALSGFSADNAGIPGHDFARRIAVFWPSLPPSVMLRPIPDRVAAIRSRLAAAGPPPYLGLTWRGGTPPSEQQGVTWTLYKEIGILPLANAVKDFPGTLIALQRRPAVEELGALSSAVGKTIHDFTDLNEDLEGMLALLDSIDEYIGVSNTNMHLRASAGKTARVLVPCPAEWRWTDCGRFSPWFPGFPIYRQSLQGDWSAALATLQRDLAHAWLRQGSQIRSAHTS